MSLSDSQDPQNPQVYDLKTTLSVVDEEVDKVHRDRSESFVNVLRPLCTQKREKELLCPSVHVAENSPQWPKEQVVILMNQTKPELKGTLLPSI